MYRHHRKLLTSLFLVGISLIFSSYQNLSAQNYLNQAASLDRQGNYQQALHSLKASSSFLVFPSLKDQLKQQIANNQKWLHYATYQNQAETYIKDGKYQAALVLLEKISRDYPTYSKVVAQINQINQRLVALQTAKTTPAKKTDVTRASATQRISPSQDCFVPTSINGKRYGNNDEFKAITAASSASQIEQYLQNFFNQYGLSLEMSNISVDEQFIKDNGVTYSEPTDQDICALRNFGLMLIDEWSKYPIDWVQNSNLKTIVLVKDMKRVFDGVAYDASAVNDIYSSQLWYDVTYTGDYMRETIHHEYYHLLTYNYTHTSDHDETDWLAANPAGFSYGKGGDWCYNPSNQCLTGEHPVPGFVTGYATASIAEDQAETYAYMMTDTYYHHLKNWIPVDTNLAAKVKLQQQFIADRSDSMDSAYFDAINP